MIHIYIEFAFSIMVVIVPVLHCS